MNPSSEEIKNSEESRVNIVMETAKEWSDLHEKMNMHYLEVIAKYQHERREIIKYLGTIAGGAAALSPQLLEHIKQPTFFYTGISLLCLVVIISVTYILSSVENESTKLLADLKKRNELIDKLRKPKLDFLKNKDYSPEAFIGAMSDGKEILTIEEKVPEKKNSWYIPLDYTGEFITWFFTTGLAMVVLSLTSFWVSWGQILYVLMSVFVIINIVSAFPNKVFMVLGAPIDLLKSLFRLSKNEIFKQ